MNKFKYMGDDKTKIFYFTFPFFTKQDIVVKINNKPVSGFRLHCTTNGMNADIPFSGGKISFATPPKTTDTITIYRKLQLNRLIDYQPNALINPKIINQDMNYMMEILKDLHHKLEGFADKYSEITDMEQISVLLKKFDAVILEMNKFDDLSTIQSTINNINNTITSLNTGLDKANINIEKINTFNDEKLDYVVESQLPTETNNYTWYRKYKSGWVEQGGRKNLEFTTNGQNNNVSLPIAMSNENYTTILTLGKRYGNKFIGIQSQTQTSIEIGAYSTTFADSGYCTWLVKGF